MKRLTLVVLALVVAVVMVPMTVGAITNPDALNGYIEFVIGIVLLTKNGGELLFEGFIVYLGAL